MKEYRTSCYFVEINSAECKILDYQLTSERCWLIDSIFKLHLLMKNIKKSSNSVNDLLTHFSLVLEHLYSPRNKRWTEKTSRAFEKSLKKMWIAIGHTLRALTKRKSSLCVYTMRRQPLYASEPYARLESGKKKRRWEIFISHHTPFFKPPLWLLLMHMRAVSRPLLLDFFFWTARLKSIGQQIHS